MAVSTVELRKQAKAKGIDGYRTMTHSELEAALSSGGGSRKSSTSARKDAPVRKDAPARKSSAPSRKPATRAASKSSNSKTPAKRASAPARKSTSTAKASGGRTSAPARRNAAPAKRQTATTARKPVAQTRKPVQAAAPKRSNSKSNGQGRIPLPSRARWNEPFNTREGSVAEEIFLALKSNKGDVEATFNSLKGRALKLAGTGRGGVKRSKEEALAWLRYRINRIKFDYLTKTGQHEPGTDRIAYGTGERAKGNGNGGGRGKSAAKAPAKRAATQSRSAARKPAGRGSGSGKPATRRSGAPARSQERKRTTARRK